MKNIIPIISKYLYNELSLCPYNFKLIGYLGHNFSTTIKCIHAHSYNLNLYIYCPLRTLILNLELQHSLRFQINNAIKQMF